MTYVQQHTYGLYLAAMTYIQQVLLNALLPVCMKYTAQGESQVANIVRGEAECCICYETLTKSYILSYK